MLSGSGGFVWGLFGFDSLSWGLSEFDGRVSCEKFRKTYRMELDILVGRLGVALRVEFFM